MITYTKKLMLVFFSLMLVLISGLPSEARAAGASLYLSPSSGTYTIGNTFSVAVKVDSGQNLINAAEATLFFSPNELGVNSVSKSGSIFSLWTTEPNFSNDSGTVSFGGGTPTSFNGASGTIITITFRAKIVSSAQVSFSSGSILVADGKGTNVLAKMNGGVYEIGPTGITPPVVPTPTPIPAPTPTGAPAAPNVSSPIHPEPEKWYSNNDPEFTWQLPPDVIKVSYVIDQNPLTNPKFIAESLIEKKSFSDLEDGIWYFHINFKNQHGWGELTHRKVLIDTQPPEPFEIIVDDEDDPTNPSPILHFKTTDYLSGIEYYEIKIGDGDAMLITTVAIKDNPYKLPPQAPGEHSILVKAVDKAGNSTIASTEVIIEPLEPPIITEFPEKPGIGDILKIGGTSKYPDNQVTVFVEKQGEKPVGRETKTDKDGNWSFIYDKTLEKGNYQIWAELTDERGAKSTSSEKINLVVTLPSLLKFGKMAIDYLTTMILLIALIVFLILIIAYAAYRISLWRKRLRKETREVEKTVIQAFRALQEEVREQIEYLDRKKGLSSSERKIRDKLEEAIKVSEAFISKEIKDVLRELE